MREEKIQSLMQALELVKKGYPLLIMQPDDRNVEGILSVICKFWDIPFEVWDNIYGRVFHAKIKEKKHVCNCELCSENMGGI
jgi:hypothetical protein